MSGRGAYRGVDLNSEELGFAALWVYELVFGRFLLLQEDAESAGDTLDTEEIVSGVGIALWRDWIERHSALYLFAGISIFSCWAVIQYSRGWYNVAMLLTGRSAGRPFLMASSTSSVVCNALLVPRPHSFLWVYAHPHLVPIHNQSKACRTPRSLMGRSTANSQRSSMSPRTESLAKPLIEVSLVDSNGRHSGARRMVEEMGE